MELSEKQKPVKRGDIIETDIIEMGFEGKSVSKIDDFVIFSNKGVTGDRVQLEILKVKSSYAEGKVIRFLKQSPLRVEPRCTHTTDCGGCKWQHVSYKAQLAAKQKHVQDAMTRIGGFTSVLVQPILGSESIFFYRNKMEYTFSNQRWVPYEETELRKPKDFAVGLHIAGRFDKILDIDACYLQSEMSNKILNLVKTHSQLLGLKPYHVKDHTGFLRNLTIRQSANTNDLMVILTTTTYEKNVMEILATQFKKEIPEVKSFINVIHSGKGPIPKGEGELIIFGESYLTEKLLGIAFIIHPFSFFQTHTKQAERLFLTAFQIANLTSEDILYDLYCGPGTIGLIAAKQVKKVVGIELVPEAIENAKENARINNITNAEFFCGDIKDHLSDIQDWKTTFGKPTIIVVDPPRAGLHEDISKILPSFDAQRILYISCNPMTQARDLQIITQSGKYEMTYCQPVDMFPHTYHIENIVLLEKKT